MALNATSAFEVLGALNFTANCTTAVAWRMLHWSTTGGSLGLPSNSIDYGFIKMAWPPNNSLDEIQMDNFYDSIAVTNPGNWTTSAFDSIDSLCYAPLLAKNVTFLDMQLTNNCTATAQYYANTLCAINPQQDGARTPWNTHHLGGYTWISNMSLELDTPSGLDMLRSAWPYNTTMLSDVALSSWTHLAFPNYTALGNYSQMASICKVCMSELCAAAKFSGNPDIAGVGVIVSYVLAAVLVSMGPILFVISKFTDKHPRPRRDSGHIGLWNGIRVGSKECQLFLLGSSWFFALSLAVTVSILWGRIGTYYEALVATSTSLLTVFALGCSMVFNWKSAFSDATQVLIYLALCLLLPIIADNAYHLITTSQPKYGDWACLKQQGGFTTRVLGLIGPTFYIGMVIVFAASFFGTIAFLLLNATLHFFARYLRPNQRDRLRRFKKWKIKLIWSSWKNKIQNDEFQKSWSWWLGTFFVFSFMVLTWMETINIILLRKAMHEISGPAWTEASWGFGQVLAIFIWLPVIFQLLEKTIDEATKKKKQEDNNPGDVQNTAETSLLPMTNTGNHHHASGDANADHH